ncbi:DUF7504 family protein [Natronorubrum daqingense]|uniref:Uncharacterized protein n=1 Tax=Natronorubrum daqingense TaxID=588898 RepID=A0A1N6XIY9_9EURY|nr:hypothetical protein [Natronorubrum daqingense]APX95941.1 hypothetical protein BB347_04530 [Natronorubrum daqingense]SIR02211.1 hypothetical protein SAMN05421809_0127 [Natronorubrum daqingense]
MDGEPIDGVSSEASFGQTLAKLKRNGSNILIVGTDASELHTTLCRRLCGGVDAPSRYRLTITDSDSTTKPCAHSSIDAPDHTRTIDVTAATPSTRVGGDTSDQTPLKTLGLESNDAIEELEERADGFEPASLRVCLDCLQRLFDAQPRDDVFQFLHLLTARVDYYNGMGHYHLPLERTDELVRLLEPLFDVLVEIRSRRGTDEHRWQFRDDGTTTEWLAF